jgi:hypothetical protein
MNVSYDSNINASRINASRQEDIVSTQPAIVRQETSESSILSRLSGNFTFSNTIASASTTETDASFMASKIPSKDSLYPLIQELDQLLHINASQIEKKLKELENNEINKQIVTALLEAGKFGFNLVKSSNENVNEGLTFLNQILPKQILDKIPPSQRMESLGSIISLGTAFLSALDIGAQGLALICKSKLLQKSKDLLEQLKATYKENLESRVALEQMDTTIQAEQPYVCSRTELQAFLKKLKEWEIQITLEEKYLPQEKLQFRLNLASKTLSFLNLPLTYLPKEWMINQLNVEAASTGLSWTTSGLGLLLSGVKLEKTTQEAYELQHWVKAYKKWQDQHQLQCKITRSHEEYEEILFKLIEQAEDLSHIRKQLKNFGITLDSTLSSKEELLQRWKRNRTYHQKLLAQYIQFQEKLDDKLQQKLDNLNILMTSENLLAKRQAIVEKKVSRLKPQFDTIKAKIYESKQSAFLRDIQQLLWEKLQDPCCTYQEIKAQFERWGFFDDVMTSQNQSVIQALEKFKDHTQKDTKKTSPEQKDLIHALAQWMQSPAMDNQFDHWFDMQSQDNLLRSYIDHQETLEHATKTALKQMVQQKHAIESHLLNFQLTTSRIQFSVAIISLTISLTLAIFGILSLPVGGAGIILLIASVGSTAISLGLLGASYWQSSYYKPNISQISTLFFKAHMVGTKLINSIQIYFHQAKEKKRLETTKILYQLHFLKNEEEKASEEYQQAYQKALINYNKAKLDFENSQEKVKHWSEKLNQLETTLNKEAWQDFAQHASLQIAENPQAFDTLQAFQEALQECDLRLLSPETQTLLKLQLGLDLEALQAQISKDKEAIKNTLREFFAMEGTDLLAFIRSQKERAYKGLLKRD